MCGALSISASGEHKKVFISQTVVHVALDRTVEGIIDGLKSAGFKQGKNLDLRKGIAQASGTLAAQIASNYIVQNPDVVVGVGTMSAQSFLKHMAGKKTKLIFSTITDPVRAGLVPDLQQRTNVSGVSNFVDLEPQLKLFLKLQPQLKRLGILYNPGEVQSVSIVKQLDELCRRLGLILVKQALNKTSEITQATTKLSTHVDAIFISNDNTILSALPGVLSIANNKKIPVYVSDTDAVQVGALAALGPNQYQIGVQTGKMIARILQGDSIQNIPVEFPDKSELYINNDVAKKLGINIPSDILENATIISKGL